MMDGLLAILCAQYGVRTEGDCLVWTRARGHGYGIVTVNQRGWQAHRLFYFLFVGEVSKGHHLHHECGNKACVNPHHLIPVTAKRHSDIDTKFGTKHRTHCPAGHAYTPSNTRVCAKQGANGNVYRHRFCRACHRAACSAYKLRTRAALGAAS